MNLSFVFPCLNEEKTLGQCIEAVQKSLDARTDLHYEIVVADNGSTDRSAEIAAGLGARVVPVKERGYGAALRGGIEAAQGTYVMFADADSTYIYEHALPLYEEAEKHDADMSIASRMTGDIEDGAMPALHRHLGTPVLTALINILFRGKLSDCNSGFRCLKKTSYESWNIRSNGMEFASELLIKALKAKARTVEIRSGLRCGPADRVAHLRTWRDGMRHLLFILSERPQLFEVAGLIVLFLSTFLQVLAAVLGPTDVFGLNVFDMHSKALLLLAALAGAQVYLFSCMLYLTGEERSTALTRKLIHLDEGVLFFLLLGIFLAQIVFIGYVFIQWALAGFRGLHLFASLMLGIHLLGVTGIIALGLLGVHVFKKGGR